MDVRIAPAAAPYPDDIQAWLDRTMPPGKPPLRLFTTLARDPRLFGRRNECGGVLAHARCVSDPRRRSRGIDQSLCEHGYERGGHSLAVPRCVR